MADEIVNYITRRKNDTTRTAFTSSFTYRTSLNRKHLYHDSIHEKL